VDPDAILKNKIAEFVNRGDFGLASGRGGAGIYDRIWFEEPLAIAEVAFEAGVFLLRKATAEALKAGKAVAPALGTGPAPGRTAPPVTEPGPTPGSGPAAATQTLRLTGTVPPEVWNRFGTKILPKLCAGLDLKIGLEFSVTVSAESANPLATDLRQILQELGFADTVKVE